MNVSQKALQSNLRTIESYEGYASQYDSLVSRTPLPFEEALRRLTAIVKSGGRVLEVGSGPGRDADFIESLGVFVRRTDATQAFLDLQRQRGKQGELLNLLTDDLGGPYDGIVALCVLIHIDQSHTSGVLDKVAAALRPGGAFLVSVREGIGETDDGEYHMTYWSRDGFAARLQDAGLTIDWESTYVNRDGDKWLTFIAGKQEA